MGKRANLVLAFGALCAFLILGGLLWQQEFREEGGESTACNVIKNAEGELKEKPVVAMGTFLLHNESFLYIGDMAEFEVRVVSSPDMQVKGRSLTNLDLSPYDVISRGEVTTQHHPECTQMLITFVLQALDVNVGTRNRFEYRSEDGGAWQPKVEYVHGGVLKELNLTYEPPLIAPLTDGKARRIYEISQHALPHKQGNTDGPQWLHIGRLYGSVFILILASFLALRGVWALRNQRRARDADTRITINDVFPELFQGGGNFSDRLYAIHFRLEELMEHTKNERLRQEGQALLGTTSVVFSGKLDDREAGDTLEVVRAFAETHQDIFVELYETFMRSGQESVQDIGGVR